MAEPPEDFSISNHGSVEAWLRTQPRNVSVALAARAALRVVPLLVLLPWRSQSWASAHICSAGFRAAAASLFASYGLFEKNSRITIQIIANRTLATVSTYIPQYEHPITPKDPNFLAYAALDDMKFAALAASADDNVSAASMAVAVICSAAAASAEAAGDAREDALSLAGGEPAALRSASARPLWPRGTPEWAHRLWSELKSVLPADEGWEIWTDWYEARLRGEPHDQSLESERLLHPTDEDWYEPRVANAKLIEAVERHRREQAEKLTQDPRGGVFTLRDGVLTLVEGTEGFAADAVTMRTTAVAALRRLTDSLVRTDQHGDLRAIAEELLRLVDHDPEYVRREAFALWAHSIALAEYRARDARNAAVPDPFDAPLDPTRRFALDAAVPPVALYARCFDEVRRYDTELANFEGSTATPAIQRAVLAAASVSGAVDTTSETIILRVIEAGEGNNGIALRARRGGWFTMRNAVLWSAGAILTGYFGQIGVDLASRHQPLDHIQRFLRTGADSIGELLHDTPADVRAAYERARSLLRERFE